MAKTRSEKTRALALGACLAAVGVALICLASVLPTARLAVVAVAGLLPAIMVLGYGLGYGFASYAATAVLALLLAPSKGAAVVYALLLGHYPMIKSLAERQRSRVLEWIIKLGVFNICLAVALFALGQLVLDFLGGEWAKWIIYIAGNVVFAVYDFAFSGLITLFNTKFAKFFKGGAER